MVLKSFAVLFGIAFLVAGILGFVPAASPNGLLLGIFSIDPMHNGIHLVTGVLALAVSRKERYAKLFFQIFGLIYLLVTILGFVMKGNVYGMYLNLADNLLHLVVAIVALYLGFVYERSLAQSK